MNAPQVKYLKDYQAPSFSVESVHLTIQVYDDHTCVKSQLRMQRQNAGDLVLLGRELELKSIQLNGQVLSAQDYQQDDEQLVIANAPEQAVLDIEVIIHPEHNTALEGLYQAGNLYVTQNEPEGFRKITYYPDRPDVLSVFTTRIEADQKYPTLLANGNLVEQGKLENNRHFTVWHDPTKKPCYLFACVIGDLAVLRDEFTTAEQRKVNLEIYALEKDIAKCHIAMEALKHSMRWDEEHYGLSYDLDNYMIVAVSQFNMGAMENKGLNIFNTSCVLADEEYTNDLAIMRVQSVIAHEYFHNWTGNRITCRDWFQLCLKEGLTVFRDQVFSEDLQSAAVQRIDDVAVLKSYQFPEDAGPLAHPPRPDHFVEINNFYTTTVYEKGAEISRMMATLLGKEKFRQGTDKYFELFDGQAVTVEDWIFALSQGSGVDLSAFLRWYNQPHTPQLIVQQHYDAAQQSYQLTFKQHIKPHSKYPDLKAVPIPVAIALFDRDSGEQLTLNCTDLMQNQVQDGMYLFTQDEASITFTGVSKAPIVSLLRNFSAPVNLEFDYSNAELAFLMQYETNGFNQWQASQTLLERILLEQQSATEYCQALQAVIPAVAKHDPLLASRLLDIPTESYLASRIEQNYQPEVVKQRRDELIAQVATALADFWKNYYQQTRPQDFAEFSLAMGVRALRNICLEMLWQLKDADTLTLAAAQYDGTKNMTERLGALRSLHWSQDASVQHYLEQFYQKFEDEGLSIDQWFLVQSSNPNLTAQGLQALMKHKDFDLTTPNRVRAVTRGVVQNPVLLWNFATDSFIDLARYFDEKNPILASATLQSLSRWYTLAEPKRSEIQAKLQALQSEVQSRNVSETLSKILSV
ncbi:MAG: aminopeptidase N [Acinetobacter sp.]|nr:aminopeptidase N [Acinetobacter sp.]